MPVTPTTEQIETFAVSMQLSGARNIMAWFKDMRGQMASAKSWPRRNSSMCRHLVALQQIRGSTWDVLVPSIARCKNVLCKEEGARAEYLRDVSALLPELDEAPPEQWPYGHLRIQGLDQVAQDILNACADPEQPFWYDGTMFYGLWGGARIKHKKRVGHLMVDSVPTRIYITDPWAGPKSCFRCLPNCPPSYTSDGTVDGRWEAHTSNSGEVCGGQAVEMLRKAQCMGDFRGIAQALFDMFSYYSPDGHLLHGVSHFLPLADPKAAWESRVRTYHPNGGGIWNHVKKRTLDEITATPVWDGATAPFITGHYGEEIPHP